MVSVVDVPIVRSEFINYSRIRIMCQRINSRGQFPLYLCDYLLVYLRELLLLLACDIFDFHNLVSDVLRSTELLDIIVRLK